MKKNNDELESELLNETLELLENSDETFTQIAEETGLHRKWISELYNGRFSDPGIKKTETLRNYLLS